MRWGTRGSEKVSSAPKARREAQRKKNPLVHIHAHFPKLQRRVPNHRQPEQSRDRRPALVLELEVELEREDRRSDSVDGVERRRSRERDEHFPRGEDVVAFDFDGRGRERFCEGRAGRTRSASTRQVEEEREIGIIDGPLAFFLLMILAAMKMGALRTTPGRARMPQAERRPRR